MAILILDNRIEILINYNDDKFLSLSYMTTRNFNIKIRMQTCVFVITILSYVEKLHYNVI